MCIRKTQISKIYNKKFEQKKKLNLVTICDLESFNPSSSSSSSSSSSFSSSFGVVVVV